MTETELRLRSSLDLAGMARLVLDVTVPDFADGGTVFVLERPLGAGEPARGGGEVAARRLGTRFAHVGEPIIQEVFPAGEMTAFAGGSPYARCVRGREPLIFTQPDSQTLERARPGGREILSRYASFLTVPATAGTEVAGFLAFARTAGAAAFSDADAATAVRLAADTGTGIANALTLMRHRFIADTLQRSLLAAEPKAPHGLDVAARCLPASGQIVGGDWYDLIALPGGRSGLIVGDVMGHGPEAAAVMAQLRAAAHALAQLDLEPAELLGHLDRVTATLRRPMLATCVYVIIDPASRSCTLSAAGHLPPVLAMPDGTTRVPDLPAGQSLGLGSAVYGQARIKFPPGAVIALYTDGLVETRTRSFDQGILAVRSVLPCGPCELDAVCDRLIGSLAERFEDDVTVVLARIPLPTGTVRRRRAREARGATRLAPLSGAPRRPDRRRGRRRGRTRAVHRPGHRDRTPRHHHRPPHARRRPVRQRQLPATHEPGRIRFRPPAPHPGNGDCPDPPGKPDPPR